MMQFLKLPGVVDTKAEHFSGVKIAQQLAILR